MPETIKDELIALAAKLFREGKISHFLGYQKGTLKFQTTPLIALNPEDLQHLWLEDFFFFNLAFYLKEIKNKVGLLVKGCDSRSLLSLIKEGQVKREDLYVVGIPCPGQIDLRKVAEAIAGEREEIEEIWRQGNEVHVRVNDQEKRLPKALALLDKCLHCRYPKPLISDFLLPGEYAPPVPPATPETTQGLSRGRDELRPKPLPEKWAFWVDQFQHCLRCYACRNVCPACFCPRCIVEENMPQWVSPLPTAGDNFVFHLMRLMHVAGTCVSCGECQRVCPMEIPLMRLHDKMAEDLEELYNFVAGIDLDQPLPFRTFRQEDADDFIK